jgi:class 3 adenylate cyclase/predicted ATPase
VDFVAVVDQVIALLRQRGRVAYRTLKVQFHLDDDALEALKDELLYAHQVARDEDERILVWTGDAGFPPTDPAAPAEPPARVPLVYTPPYLAEKILTSRSALEGERKQVTVLFADLKGSLELLADRDPEEARQLLDPVLERMMAAVHRYEGTVNQVMGDGIMALFGAPLAHEDHAIRACYAALRMQESVMQYSEEIQRSHGVPVQIRVGLNSGEVVVRAIDSDLHMDYTAVGQTTHLAARMEQMARPGSVLVTAATLQLAEGYIQVKPLGPIPIRGLADPLEVCELLGAGPTRTYLQAFAARGLTRFVGRQAEFEALRQALERAGAGHGQVVAVMGEPGVGKTRLFYEFIRSHRTRGWLVLESRSVSWGKATAYLPLSDLLKLYFQVEERDEARTIREKVAGKLVTLDTALGPTLPAFLTLLDIPVEEASWQALDPPQRRQRTLEAMKRLVLRESQVQPLLLVVENLHWIDAETQAFLDSVIESLPTGRILLLVNYRPDYQHGWGSRTYYMQLRLDPLPRESAEELLDVLVGDDASLHPLRRMLIERTEGNPFFLEESIRTLVETQGLVGEQGSYRLARALPGIQVPATVQAVLAARIDRLAPDEKRLLQTAAVIGTDVSYTPLHTVAGMPEAALRQGLARLQAAEFLYETCLFPDFAYTFKHALTHEVAYHSLLLERRRDLHERTAQAMEALWHDELEEHYSELAHHYSRSGNTAQAVTYCQRAGHQAVQRSANADAISHLTTALELFQTLPDTAERTQQEVDLLTTLGPALIVTKGYAAPEVEHVYARARELCRQLGESLQLFHVLRGLFIFYLNRGALQTARELGEQLLILAQRQHAPPLLLEAHFAVGATLFWLGEVIPAHAHLEQGMALYDPHQHHSHAFLYGQDPGVACLSLAALALWVLGYPDQALARIHEALTLAYERPHPFSLARALIYTGRLHQFRGEPHLTQARAEAAVTLSTEQGLVYWCAEGTILRGWALAAQGQSVEGIAQMCQGLATHQATGAELVRPYLLPLLAETYAQGGRVDEGLRVLDQALVSVHTTGERWWEAELHRLKGELLLALSAEKYAEAETCFHQALDSARRQEAKALELRAARSLARLWQQQGRRAEAQALLAPIYGWFTEGFDTADLQEAKALLAELEGEHGRG